MTSAQEIREFMNRLSVINEDFSSTPGADGAVGNNPPKEKVSKTTGNVSHDITTTELNRLKITLRPLVSDELQSRFVQALNKMRSGAPMGTSEMKLITVAFIAMADIIADDAALTIRLRNTIQNYNLSATSDAKDDKNVEFDDGETAEETPDIVPPRDEKENLDISR